VFGKARKHGKHTYEVNDQNKTIVNASSQQATDFFLVTSESTNQSNPIHTPVQ